MHKHKHKHKHTNTLHIHTYTYIQTKIHSHIHTYIHILGYNCATVCIQFSFRNGDFNQKPTIWVSLSDYACFLLILDFDLYPSHCDFC